MEKVVAALGDKKPTSVAFVWMQGEKDAKFGWQDAYYEALRGTVGQFANNLNTEHCRRHRSSKRSPKRRQSLDAIRAIQEKVAADEPFGAWVDTDDLNPTYQARGCTTESPSYVELGRPLRRTVDRTNSRARSEVRQPCRQAVSAAHGHHSRSTN